MNIFNNKEADDHPCKGCKQFKIHYIKSTAKVYEEEPPLDAIIWLPMCQRLVPKNRDNLQYEANLHLATHRCREYEKNS